jgi:hypothetical protein
LARPDRGAKGTILAAGSKADELCGIRSINTIDKLWKQHKKEEEWGFLLIDASNAFNELNQMAMLWTIWHG